MTDSYLKKVDHRICTYKEQTLFLDLGDMPTTGDILVRKVETELKEMLKNKTLQGGKLLKVYGKSSLLLSYVIAHQLAHLYSAIAVSEPRLGAYVVVISTNPAYPLGSRINFQTGEVKIVLPTSHTKEPAFSLHWHETDHILQAELNRGVQVDGDEIVREILRQFAPKDSSLAKSLKGGKLLKINGRCSILAAFVLANHLAHLYSAIAVNDPKIGIADTDLQGTVHNLRRGQKLSERPIIKALAQLLSNLAEE